MKTEKALKPKLILVSTNIVDIKNFNRRKIMKAHVKHVVITAVIALVVIALVNRNTFGIAKLVAPPKAA